MPKILILLVTSFAVIFSEAVMAAPWDTTATKIHDFLTGGLIRTIAIIIFISTGIALITEKLYFIIAVKIMVGIIFIFLILPFVLSFF